MTSGTNAWLEVGGKRTELGPDGHLMHVNDWSVAVAEEMAARDGVELNDLHWWLIRFVRQHYFEYGMAPLLRVVIQAMRRDKVVENPSSRVLYRLFPDGPMREACRFGGLPRPESCI